MTDIIRNKLSELEREHQIKILYACESGSRAWGFASPDSDFDVRFIYARGLNNYLSLNEAKDTVDLPVNELLDFGGWDIRKALKLFLKSNATFYEWLQSPIVYREDNAFATELRALMSGYFSLKAGGNHYLSMAHNTNAGSSSRTSKIKKILLRLTPGIGLFMDNNKTAGAANGIYSVTDFNNRFACTSSC